MLIDWFTVIAQAANFLILVWLMKRYLYQPVLTAIDARETRIAAQLKDAEVKQTAAEQEREAFQQKNAAFEQRRDTLLKTAQNDAAAERKKLLEEAHKESDALRAKLDAAVQSERVALNLEVVKGVRQEVFAIARRALADLAAVDVETQIVKVFTGRLHALDDQEKTKLAAAMKASPEPALVYSAFELPALQREAIQQALRDAFGAEVPVKFATTPRLICGIELNAHGQKLAWSIDDYLSSLDKQMNELLEPTVKVSAK
jgi:F-type H+-transporting ATPase subunit b